MATLNENVLANHTPISISNLRNGAVADISRTARQSSLAGKYHYAGVRYTAEFAGDEATFAPAVPATAIFEASFRTAFANLVESTANAALRAATAAGRVIGIGALRTESAANPALRLEAIALGATWTAACLSYAITDADLSPTERVDPMFTLAPPPAAADQATYSALVRAPFSGWTVALASAHVAADPAHNAAGNLSELEVTALTAAALTAIEAEVAFACITIATASPPRAGAQLTMSDHHYLSDAASCKRHRATENEVLAKVGPDAVALYKANSEAIRKNIWHSGIHAIAVSVLVGFSRDADISEKLKATGIGSMAIGLPAYEDLFKRSGSYLAVLTQVAPTAKGHSHIITLTALTECVAALKDLGMDGPFPAQKPTWKGSLATAWTAGCDTRAKVLNAYLVPELDRAEPVVAWLFGYYKEMAEAAGLRRNTQGGSLLASFSLQRAVQNYVGEANKATEMYAARIKFVKEQGKTGKLETYTAEF